MLYVQGPITFCLYKDDLGYRKCNNNKSDYIIHIQNYTLSNTTHVNQQSVPMQEDSESCGLCVIMVSGCVSSSQSDNI